MLEEAVLINWVVQISQPQKETFPQEIKFILILNLRMTMIILEGDLKELRD